MRTIAACLLLLLLPACSTDDVEESPDAAPPPTCANAFDERCAATNGCGEAGAFCCYRFADSGAVNSVCHAEGTACVSDICIAAAP